MDDYGVDVPKVFLATLLAVILVAAVIVGLAAVYYRYEAGRETSGRFLEPPARLEALQAEQQKRLSAYDVVDGDKAVVAIPIDRAMELVVEELSGPQPGGTSPAGVAAEEDDDAK